MACGVRRHKAKWWITILTNGHMSTSRMRHLTRSTRARHERCGLYVLWQMRSTNIRAQPEPDRRHKSLLWVSAALATLKRLHSPTFRVSRADKACRIIACHKFGHSDAPHNAQMLPSEASSTFYSLRPALTLMFQVLVCTNATSRLTNRHADYRKATVAEVTMSYQTIVPRAQSGFGEKPNQDRMLIGRWHTCVRKFAARCAPNCPRIPH